MLIRLRVSTETLPKQTLHTHIVRINHFNTLRLWYNKLHISLFIVNPDVAVTSADGWNLFQRCSISLISRGNYSSRSTACLLQSMTACEKIHGSPFLWNTMLSTCHHWYHSMAAWKHWVCVCVWGSFYFLITLWLFLLIVVYSLQHASLTMKVLNNGMSASLSSWVCDWVTNSSNQFQRDSKTLYHPHVMTAGPDVV